MNTFVPHVAGSASEKNERPYCCECDYCHTDGITCRGMVSVIVFAPDENNHIQVCDNHIANALWEAHEHLAANPEMRVSHNVYDGDYVSGSMPPGTGWVSS